MLHHATVLLNVDFANCVWQFWSLNKDKSQPTKIMSHCVARMDEINVTLNFIYLARIDSKQKIWKHNTFFLYAMCWWFHVFISFDEYIHTLPAPARALMSACNHQEIGQLGPGRAVLHWVSGGGFFREVPALGFQIPWGFITEGAVSDTLEGRNCQGVRKSHRPAGNHS